MESYSCEAITCFSGCLLICGMIAFMAFNIWKEEFMKYTRLQLQQIKRPKNTFLKSHKEAVENNDETFCATVSFVTSLVILKKLFASFLAFFVIKDCCSRTQSINLRERQEKRQPLIAL